MNQRPSDVASITPSFVRRWREKWNTRHWGSTRLALWGALIALVLAVLGTLVWLAGRYEASQVQAELERDTSDAVNDLRTALSRDVQSLQGLLATQPKPDEWHAQVQGLLAQHREWLRVEWRDTQMLLRTGIDSPMRAPVFERTPRSDAISEILQACQRAKRSNGPAYSGSYYLPQYDGLGMEVMELCLPVTQEGALTGYTLVTYSLQELLTERLVANYGRRNEISFTEADGTRLAMVGAQRRGQRLFTAQQLLDLPGTTMVLRMDGRRSAPDLFPNLLTALIGSADPNVAANLTLLAISAVALGGVSLAGGSGGLAAAILGAVAIFLLQAALTFFNVSTFLLQIAYGLVLTLADGTALPLTNWTYRIEPRAGGDPPRAPWDTLAGVSTLYNGMLAPMGPYAYAGLAWYQGETLLSLLESSEVERELERHPVRLPVPSAAGPRCAGRVPPAATAPPASPAAPPTARPRASSTWPCAVRWEGVPTGG